MSTGERWDCLVIPAIALEDQTYRIGPKEDDVYPRRAGEVLLPEREPRAVLDEMRAAIGSMTFSAQYQQDPIPPGGNVIKRQWLRYFTTEPGQFDRLVCSWDTASTLSETSSYSVGMLWGEIGPDYYVLEIVRGRWETPVLRRHIVASHNAWEPDVTLIEDTELGRSLRQDIWSTHSIRLELRRPRYDKAARLLAQSARFEAGQVHIAQDQDWTKPYVDELLAFPYGRSDDQVDATSQALDYLTTSAARRGPIVRRNMTRRPSERRGTDDQARAASDNDDDENERRQPRPFRGTGSVPFGYYDT